MKKKVSWEEIKKRKSAYAPRFENDVLMAKAVEVAELISKFRFVKAVCLFGSTARGEDGNDIDLLVLDDGTVSNVAFQNFIVNKMNPEREYSGGGYADACYFAFINMFPGDSLNQKVKSPLCKKLYEDPSVDVIFVDMRIKHDAEYLNELVLSGNDPMFFRNVGQDALLFYRNKREFIKNENFPNSVNKGILERSASALAIVVQEKQIVRFDSIAGQAEAKKEIARLYSAFQNREHYKKWSTEPPRGICLYGPPGNGKTMLVKAFASQCSVPFYLEDASKIVSMWYGEGEKNLDNVFDKAQKTGGVIFFDEADSIASSRNSPYAHEASKRMVATLCRKMDGFETSDKVVVFFSTNRLKDIDPAVLRPGRIDRIIEVPLLNRDGRRELIEINVRDREKSAGRKLFEPLGVAMGEDIADIVVLAEKIANKKIGALLDMDAMLDKTDGFSGADMHEIIRRTLEQKVIEEESGKNPGLVIAADILEQIILYEGR